MKTRAELFAYFGECLTASSIIWIAAVTLIMMDSETPLPGAGWPLLMTLAAAVIYVLILRRGVTISALAVISAVMLAGEITAFMFLREGKVTFAYVLSSVLMAVISVYVSMYLCIKKQVLAKHMTYIDVIIGFLVWLLIFYTASGADTVSLLCVIAVTVMNAAAAIGLRMSEEGMEEGIGKAFALAAVSSAAAAGIVFLLVKLFSRSGAVTGAVLTGIKNFFLAMGALIGRFLEWLMSFMSEPEIEAVPDAAPQTGIGDVDMSMEQLQVNPVIPAVIIGAAVMVAVIIILRKMAGSRFSLSMKVSGGSVRIRSRRKKGLIALKWQRFKENARFRLKALLGRNTPPGVLVWLERKARKKKIPRLGGESVREFTLRLSPEGRLDRLAGDLEGKFYGNSAYSLSAGECRSIRKEMRRILKKR